ncbi:response regulator [Marinobacter sp. JSM 1782161]|uniref:response regulator n=1 Tax=Marinobacter sp. JSM 1782161 TaxID=2685906 RepID=UPI00140395E0|nr:response regulator [Marinobacter sp. JSM 1782161]
MDILLIEDEIELASILGEYLHQHGFEVTHLTDGHLATQTILSHPWDMVLLDLGLPRADGIDICRRVRQTSHVPIIMITARVEEVDRLIGLELGADDYICKPFSPREVVARVKTVMRRTAAASPLSDGRPGLTLDEGTLTAAYDGSRVQLTLVEWRILSALCSQSGRIFSRDQIMSHAYDDQRVVNDRTIDSHINKVRKKLFSLTGQDIIHSVYGVGYKLELPQRTGGRKRRRAVAANGRA